MTVHADIAPPVSPAVPDKVDELSQFCQRVFSSLSRSDQRRWAEVYVRGLIGVPGRKSIRRISDYMVGWRADQCLQQFVNQSPWKWVPVRQVLAQEVAATLRPQAWIVSEAVFPKNGESSVGVARQYAPPARRILNCQLGQVVLLANDNAACAVNWRLLLPRCWDDDEDRRTRTQVPDEVRHRPRWSYVLEALDEMVAWDLAPMPVLVDAHQEPEVEPLLRGLDERGMRYVVRVSENVPAMPAATAQYGLPRPRTVGELAALDQRNRVTLRWQDRARGRTVSSQFATSAVQPERRTTTVPTQAMRGARYVRPRRILAEWASGSRRPSALWLTNMEADRLADVINLVKMHGRGREDLGHLEDNFGLLHFEGRSFRGWHHYVTLVSVAHAFWKLQQLSEEDEYRLQTAPT